MKYTVMLHYDDIDGSLYTGEKANVVLNIEADDLATAYSLASHLKKVFHADYYTVEEE